jgi:hypothetical protein
MYYNVCHSPAAVGALTLVLGARVVNNNTNLRLCWAAVAYFIFWREYLSSAEKQEGVHGSPQVSLDLCTGLAITLLQLWAQLWNIKILELGLPGHTQRENRGVQQLSFWTVAIPLRAVEQKLQGLCSFPRGFGGPEGYPLTWIGSSLFFSSLPKPPSYGDFNRFKNTIFILV